jgi:hypothetical protein
MVHMLSLYERGEYDSKSNNFLGWRHFREQAWSFSSYHQRPFVFMYRPTMRKNQSKDRGCQTKPAKLATSMQQAQIGKGNKNRSV